MELAFRYSVMDLNDHEGAAGQPTPAGGVRGGRQQILGAAMRVFALDGYGSAAIAETATNVDLTAKPAALSREQDRYIACGIGSRESALPALARSSAGLHA